jgi:hypothetical protein
MTFAPVVAARNIKDVVGRSEQRQESGMARKHKPSDWMPRGWPDAADENAVDRLFPQNKICELIGFLKLEDVEPDALKRTALEEHYRKMIHWAISDIIVAKNLTKRATPSQRKAILAKIQKEAKTLHALLERMDFDSSEDLRRAIVADKNPLARRETPVKLAITWGGGTTIALPKPQKGKAPPPVPPMLGVHDLEELMKEIKQLEKCAEQAATNADYKKEGNNRADIKFWLAKNALKIWASVGHRPTLISDDKTSRKYGPFLDFVSALADPLRLLPMEDAAKIAIDEWKQGNKTMEKNGAK